MIHSAAVVGCLSMIEHVHTHNKNFGVHSLAYLIDVVTFFISSTNCAICFLSYELFNTFSISSNSSNAHFPFRRCTEVYIRIIINLSISGEASPSVQRYLPIRTTKAAHSNASYLHRQQTIQVPDCFLDFTTIYQIPAIEDGIHEAQRCSNCFHDPCILSYSAQLNDQGAHNALSEGEVYLATQCLLMPNAQACMCGILPPTTHTCRGSYVLNHRELGSLHIPQLHRAILDVFFRPCIPALPLLPLILLSRICL